jgi:nucleoside-diphosphate-sugar epimerase
MKLVVTGGAGFLGARLISTLLYAQPPAGFPQFASIVSVDLAPCPVDDPRVQSVTGNIADAAFISSVITPDVTAIYHLAAVVSGQAEAEFDVGMAVNLDGTRTLLEAARKLPNPPRFVFASSLAVFGGKLPDVVPEDIAVLPQSSYGAQKAMGELMVNDFSRKGFIDGRVCRLPTIVVRPGKPNAAASSFASGIIREPLAGVDSVCPVPTGTRLWLSSPATVIRNLIHAGAVDGAKLEGRRTLNLPGICVTVADMLDSLERIGGAEARARVTLAEDERIKKIVLSWPGDFDVSRPLSLGFTRDRDFDSVVQSYRQDQAR